MKNERSNISLKQIKQFRSMALNHALSKKVYNQDAEDFASFCVLKLLEGESILKSLNWYFADYNRAHCGRNGQKKIILLENTETKEFIFENNAVSLNCLNKNDSRKITLKDILPYLIFEDDFDMIMLSLITKGSEKKIRSFYGSNVFSQMIFKQRRKYKDAFKEIKLKGFSKKYQYNDNASKFHINWITI